MSLTSYRAAPPRAKLCLAQPTRVMRSIAKSAARTFLRQLACVMLIIGKLAVVFFRPSIERFFWSSVTRPTGRADRMVREPKGTDVPAGD